MVCEADKIGYLTRAAWSRLTVGDLEAERITLLAFASRERRPDVAGLSLELLVGPEHREAFQTLRGYLAGDASLLPRVQYWLGRLGWRPGGCPTAVEAVAALERVKTLYSRRTIQARFDEVQELLTDCRPLEEIAQALRRLAAEIEGPKRDENGTATAADG